MSATRTKPPPFWQPRPADFQIPTDQHSYVPPSQNGGPPSWSRPYQPRGHLPYEGSQENGRDEPAYPPKGPRGQYTTQHGERSNASHSSVSPSSERGHAQDHTASPPRGANKNWRGLGRGAASRPHAGERPSLTPQSPSSVPSAALPGQGSSSPTLDPRAADFKPRGGCKGPATRSRSTSTAWADLDINHYMLTRPPGLPSPRLGTNGPIVSGHIPRGDAALELLALWEETDSSTWPMDADTDGGSSTRAETGSEAEPVVEVVKQELAGGAKFEFVGSTLVAASKEAIGQASQAHDLTASLVGTSEVSSTVPSSAISSVPEKASSTRDGSLELKGLLGSPEVSVLQGGPDNKAGSLNLSGSESMATGKAHKRAALPTTETVSSTAFTAPGGTQTPDESLAGFPVLTPTPTPLSFSPLTVTATSSRASESTPDLDDDPSRRTSTTSSAYTPRRSIASMEHRGGPIGQQLREAKSDRLEARIEVLAADLEILRLELAQLRGG